MTLTSEPSTPDVDIEAEVGAFAERMFDSGIAALELVTIELGTRLGLYQALAEGPCTSGELAARAGIHERYAREWLEQQAAAGIVRLVAGDEVGFELPPGHALALLDQESPAYLVPLASFVATAGTVLPMLVDAFRTGGGVPYAAYDVHEAQAAFNRPSFVHELAQSWLPAVPGLVDRLSSGAARVAEIGCGGGWASIAIARAFSGVTVDAFDVDDASVSMARGNVAEAGLAERVHVEVADGGGILSRDGRYDLVFCVETIHDVPFPVDVLAAMRRLVAPGGSVLVIEPGPSDDPETPAGPFERLAHSSSVLHCLPVGMNEVGSAATGSVMRTSTFRSYAEAAGFASVEVLPVDHPMFHFYRLEG
ncbi:MAG: methyltransferase domain-containing protein [Actinomycetota bacterium]|nr:methyltransferase domain-containing protein [Actinomycetota bacterium]